MTNESDSIRHAEYCTACQKLVPSKGMHWKDEHDCALDVDILPVQPTHGTDEYIAKKHEMGHFGPHMWMDVDGQEMCAECGAVRLSDDVIDAYVGDD